MAADKFEKKNKRTIGFKGIHRAEIDGDRLKLPDEFSMIFGKDMTIAIWEHDEESSLSGAKEENLLIYGKDLIDGDSASSIRTRSVVKITDEGFLIIPQNSPYRSALKEDDVVIVGLLASFEIYGKNEWEDSTDSDKIDVERYAKVLDHIFKQIK